MVKIHSDGKRGNLIHSLRGLLFPISSKGSFICTIPQTGQYIPFPLLHQLWSTGLGPSRGVDLMIHHIMSRLSYFISKILYYLMEVFLFLYFARFSPPPPWLVVRLVAVSGRTLRTVWSLK